MKKIIPVELVITLKVDEDTPVKAARAVVEWISKTKVADHITILSIKVPQDGVVILA